MRLREGDGVAALAAGLATEDVLLLEPGGRAYASKAAAVQVRGTGLERSVQGCLRKRKGGVGAGGEAGSCVWLQGCVKATVCNSL